MSWSPIFLSADAYVTRSVLTTKRPAGGPAFKGGVSSWPKLERELRLLLRRQLDDGADHAA